MEIGLGILREVKVYDNIDGLYIDATGQKVRADEVATYTVAKIVKYPITSRLQHLGVGVEA